MIAPTVAEVGGRLLVRPVGVTGWLPARLEWEDADADAALVLVEDEQWRAPAGESVLRWGELTGSDPVPCAAVGFPWASARPDLARDTVHLYGQLAPLGQLKQGRVDLDVASASPSARPDGSPWAGMSGAGVIAGLDPAYRPVSRRLRPAPSTLLHPEHGLVPFLGRQALLDQITSWCQGPPGTPVLLVTGGDGSGKTRLGREACVQMLLAGWDAGLANDQRRNGAPATRLQPDGRPFPRITASPCPVSRQSPRSQIRHPRTRSHTQSQNTNLPVP